MIAFKRVSVAARQPASPDLDRNVFIRPVAHRGLHDATRGRLENTGPAFRAAIDEGYGIECDLQAAADGTPMVFHDDRLDRLVAASGPIARYSPAVLSGFRYKGLDQRILTFAQFLELVGGRVPLLVEVKSKGRALNAALLDKVARQARSYQGPIALMSFNPAVVTALGERAPAIPRGAVVGGKQVLASLWAGRGRAGESVAASRALGSARGSVSFYAVDVKLVAGARTWMTRNGVNLPLFTWTVRTLRQRAAAARWADAPIFEGYEP